MSLSLSIATEHFDILFELVGFFSLSFFFLFDIYLCIYVYDLIVVLLWLCV